MTGTLFSLEVQPHIPARLKRLEEMAGDLFYSWERQVRTLFFRLDPQLWEACGHNPKLFLRRVSQERLEHAAQDRVFLVDYNRALSVYDTYQREPAQPCVEEHINPHEDLIAYFCAEFGLHESLPIYSGGLGILAGDHCKAASDLVLPFVGVGLLYRQGYFRQTIDADGNQIATYHSNDFADLPVSPARDAAGEEVRITVPLPGRTVLLRVWRAKAGRISIYLLDSDLPENGEADRSITYQLYGGDTNTRIQQELVLGIGGVRALRALGIAPTAWHINEGHAAFQVLERVREHVQRGLDFDSALEAVAAGTVFTTHTPVPAGHDVFHPELMRNHFNDYVRELGITFERFLALGATPNGDGFNQTALALRGSRFHNGVSRIHGEVASRMEQFIWPEVPPEENPMRHVTNGVHVPTFLARDWANLFDLRFGGEWMNRLRDVEYWRCIEEIPDHHYWSVRQSLKTEMLADVRERLAFQLQRNGASEARIRDCVRYLNPHSTDVLTIGFARRFATYKRATLFLADPARLGAILNNPERPVVMIFAGKAHPSDHPGQGLIRTIHDYSMRPEFRGKIILLEGYDMGLARKLVRGVDVWLNNPEYPMEASGTSGEKAGINGVINLSVLDGWWAEGYDGSNGWSIAPHGPSYDAGYRDRQEGHDLLEILQHKVAPLYYERNNHGYSRGWVKRSKASMMTLLPRFNATRMLMDYVQGAYSPATVQRKRLLADNAWGARELAAWKQKVRELWPKVRVRRDDVPLAAVTAGDSISIRVAAALGGLAPDDVTVECLIGDQPGNGDFTIRERCRLSPSLTNDRGETLFSIDFKPDLPGLQYYKLRIYPHHRLLAHPFELGRMIWL